MYLSIYASKKDHGSLVNKIGKYLDKNIDGAFKIQFHPMNCEVTMRMYYQVPNHPETLDEMHFLIDITSYQNKVRINLTEVTAMEKTIGQLIFLDDELNDLTLVKKQILNKIKRFIDKEYAEYDFIY